MYDREREDSVVRGKGDTTQAGDAHTKVALPVHKQQLNCGAGNDKRCWGPRRSDSLESNILRR